MRKGLRWSLAGVVGLVVAASLLVIPALGDGPITTDVGTLRLQLNSSVDRVIFDPIAPGPDVVQNLSQTNCKLASNNLLSITGSTTQVNKQPFAGLKDHRIGVGQRGEGTGEPCARINQSLGQSLTVQPIGVLDGMAIDYAELDLGFKFDGVATLVLSRGGVEISDSPITVECNLLSDCGPDSGGNDNVRVVLDVSEPFDTIVISTDTIGGAVSLEGGLGGTGDTFFHLVEAFDGEIDCLESVTLGSGNATNHITRGNDTNGGCKGPTDGLLFNFDSGVDESGRLFVDFVTEPVAGSAVSQFLEVITWTYASPPAVPGNAQQKTLFYDDHVGAGERVMPWCLIEPRVGGTLPPGLDPTDVLPGDHTSCLIDSDSHVTLTGAWVKVDTVYNIGDGRRAGN